MSHTSKFWKQVVFLTESSATGLYRSALHEDKAPFHPPAYLDQFICHWQHSIVPYQKISLNISTGKPQSTQDYYPIPAVHKYLSFSSENKGRKGICFAFIDVQFYSLPGISKVILFATSHLHFPIHIWSRWDTACPLLLHLSLGSYLKARITEMGIQAAEKGEHSGHSRGGKIKGSLALQG